MKNLILMIAVLVVSACASMPTMKSVAGTYEGKYRGATRKVVLLENGLLEAYTNGKKSRRTFRWKVVGSDIQFEWEAEDITMNRINSDDSLTLVSSVGENGVRKDIPKERQFTLKKIK